MAVRRVRPSRPLAPHGLTGHLVGFVEALRGRGSSVGPSETVDAGRVMGVQHESLGVQHESLGVQRDTHGMVAESLDVQRAALDRLTAALEIARQTLAHAASIDRKTGGQVAPPVVP